MPAVPEAVDTFELVFEFEYQDVPVILYRCSKTGLRLAVAQVQSPTVHGYFATQTEAFDDYGSPHTLEHLIFLGSERYPYKGVLDILANRCLAQGTNAWTDTDHTCYTVDTAGSEGFLNILPIYLDHVLFPTLTDSGFITEVHHVTGEGANAGVVYCEMQARENEADDMVDRAMKLAMYPGRCSYKSETGGRLKELRELTNEMVREYHKTYYRPDNLCVIVTGQVDCAALCKACAPTVESILKSDRIKSLPPLEKPFSSPVPKPSESARISIAFPAEDEESGAKCEFAWHGPAWDDMAEIAALQMWLVYLTQDSIAPLQKAFVEKDPALCGEVGFGMSEQTVYLFHISLSSINVKELSTRDVDEELSSILKDHVKDAGACIDMKRMTSLIEQKRRQSLSDVEESPHDFYSGEIIGSFLYASDFAPKAAGGSGTPGASLKARLDRPAQLSKLLEWKADQWARVCERWMLGASSSPRVTVIGTPSKACGKKLQSDDASRIEAQKKALGEKGCKEAAEAVKKAEEENETDTPEELEKSFQLPDVSKIRLIEVSTVKVDGGKGTIQSVYGEDAGRLKDMLQSASGASIPEMSMQFDHVTGAQFVECQVMLPVDGLSVEQLELLPLWCDVAFELPLAASDLGPAMDYESVVGALTDITVDKHCSVGFGGGRFGVGSAPNMLVVSMKVEKSRYTEAPLWIARMLADTMFDVERLKTAVKRILNDVPNSKRDGSGLMRLAMRALRFRDDSTYGAFNVFRIERLFSKSLSKPAGLQKAAQDLESIRTALLAASMFARVGGDVLSLGDGILKPWRSAPFVSASSEGRAPVVAPALMRELYAKDKVRPTKGKTLGCLLSSSAEESNYWTVDLDCFTDPRSPELAPLLVAIEYITALEGPFWRKIRGKGLSYSYSMNHFLELGIIRFSLSKATDPVGAFLQAAQIVSCLCMESDDQDEAEDTAGKNVPKEKNPGGEENGDEGGDEDDEDDDDEEDDEDELGLDPSSLEAAQSGVLFQLIEPIDTIPGAMGQAFDNTIVQQPPDQLQWLLKEVQGTTADSVQAAMKSYILPLFDGSKGRMVSLMCPAQKRSKIQAELRKVKPAFNVVHLDVDTFVKTLSPAEGYAGLRALVAEGGKGKTAAKSKAKGGGKASGAERRIDPEDGIAYTFDEISAHYTGTYSKSGIRTYWEAQCSVAKGGKASKVNAEKRVDPEDGVAYTFDELAAFYKGKYKQNVLQAYWDSTCTSVRSRQPRSKAKAKSKAATRT
mmetsp:Transcript_23076/g.64999  ORF Transcript_23076/g.64999 Transcript_23076/m.64999 type:complete len:1253 (+) Transcript_23076:22-3780(+)